MKYKRWLLFFVIILASLACPEPQPISDIEGIWQGVLQFPGFASRIIFHIEKLPEGALTARMLNPDHNDREIPVTQVQFKNNQVHLEIEALKMTFKGELNYPEETISGKWKQGRIEQALKLRKVDKITKPARPQTPTPPFPYKIEEVSFRNETGNAYLSGTLTYPQADSTFTALILISGGGRHDRDYTIARHKPFWVIADYFTRQGIAVLRFDERGVGGSTGDRSRTTIEDMALDVLAAVDFLNSNSYFNVGRIGLLGHSEGGMIAELAALQSKAVSFIITLGTPGLSGRDYQLQFEETSSRALGMDERRIAARKEFQERVFDILLNEADTAIVRRELNMHLDTIKPPLPQEKRKTTLDRFTSPWFRYNLSYNPTIALQKIKCPVLALFGEKDLHVPPERNADAVRMALQSGGNKTSQVVVLPNLNHFFQINREDIPFNYGKFEETISPKALEFIEEWIDHYIGIN